MSNEASTVLPPTQETVDADQTIAGLVCVVDYNVPTSPYMHAS